MSTYQVAYNQTTRVALIQADGAGVPGGSVDIGSFEHPDPINPGSEVVFHAVRDLLYKRSAANAANNAMFPDNITDMHNVKIQLAAGIEPEELIVVTGLSFAEAEYTVADGGTVQLELNVEPISASDDEIDYVSSAPAVATVSATGLVTGVSAGTAVITASSSENENITATTTVTVTA